MLLIPCLLLSAVALSHAGGDHTKGGIKGHHAAASTKQQAAAATPFVSADPGFGTRVFAGKKSDASEVKGGSASVLVPIPEDAPASATASKKTVISSASNQGTMRFNAPVYRDPIALPVANQPAVTTLKTVKTVASASGPQSIKTVDKPVQPSILTQEQMKPVDVLPIQNTVSDTLPTPLVPSSQVFGGAREVIVYDDGTIVDVGSVSDAGVLANADLKPLIGKPQLNADGGLSGGAKEVIVYEDGTIEEVGAIAKQTSVKPGSYGISSSTVTSAKKPATRSGAKPDLKIQRRPVEAIAPPKPKPVQVSSQQNINAELKEINRQLLQRQNQEGFIQTFGGVVKPDSNLDDIAISLSQMSSYGSEKAAEIPQPKQVSSPIRPVSASAAAKSTPFATISSLRTTGATRIASQAPKVSVQSPAIRDLNENIKLINQQLIQRQNQEGVLQAFGGVVSSEAELTGLPVSLDQFGGFQAPQPLVPTVELKKPVALPKTPKPFTSANKGQTFKYTGTGVTSGILGSSVSSFIPGSAVNQRYNNPEFFGARIDSYGVNDNLKLINRQLIQRQNQEGVLQAFGGVVKSEADLTGLPISLDQISGYGSNQPFTPLIQPKQPVTAVKPKVVSSNTGRDQTFKYTGTRVTSGILGPSAPRVIPSRVNIGTTQTRSDLRNSAGSVYSNENLKLINRQLIQRQNDDGILKTFVGVAKTESELAGIAVSLSQLGDLSRPKILPQVRNPVSNRDEKLKYTGSRVAAGQTGLYGTRNAPAQVVFGSAAGSTDSTRSGIQQVSVAKPKISSQSQPQLNLNDNIKLINRQLIQKQDEKGFSQTFGGIVKSDSDINGVSFTLDQIGNLPQIEGYKLEVPVIQSTGSEVDNKDQSFKNIYSSPAIGTLPFKPNSQDKVIPQNVDIIALNRGLIQKQNQAGVLQTFGGIAETEAGLEGIAVSLEDFKDLTRVGSLEETPTTRAVTPKRTSPTVSLEVPKQQEVRIQTTGAQRYAPARVSPQNTASRIANNQRTVTRTSGINTFASGGSAAAISSQDAKQSSSQSGLSDELININRQLIEKQNRDGLQQTFGGIIKNEDELADGKIYIDELHEITKLVGFNAPKEQGPQTYSYSASSGQSRTGTSSFTPIEQSQIATGILPAGFLDEADQDSRGQLQVQVEDIDEPSIQSQIKDVPPIPAPITQTFKQEDLQENVPFEIPNYSPPLKPYNYRTQIRTSASDNQEQQKIEQVFV